MPRTAQEYEKVFVQAGAYPDGASVTPVSAVVGIDVDSMAGSGTSVFGDFGEAVCWFWRICEDLQGVGPNTWIPDEEASAQLRQGRRRFRALLTRFVEDGYTPEMGKELHDIVFDLLGGGWAVGGYEVGEVEVLPGDLDKVIGWWWGDPDEDNYFADLVAAGKPVPQFDFSNPEHFALLKEHLTQLAEY